VFTEFKDVAVNEELVLNTIVTINNLSFYNVVGSVITNKRLAITERKSFNCECFQFVMADVYSFNV